MGRRQINKGEEEKEGRIVRDVRGKVILVRGN